MSADDDMRPPRLLVAGVGNVLRQDDGFGIAVAHRLLARDDWPEGVTIVETGIGGIHLVQELMQGYDALLILDAVVRGGEPGRLYLLDVDVGDLHAMPLDEQRAFLADMHYTNPQRALMLAKGLGALPPHVYLLGCEAADHDDFALGLSEAVEAALPEAVARVEAWITQMQTAAAPS